MLRLATWNLWWRFGPWEDRQAAIVSTLDDLGADVVCLQEVWGEEGGPDQAAVLAGGLDMQVTRTHQRFRNGLSFGNAILSRHPIESAAEIALPGRDGSPGHRSAVLARVAAPFGSVPVISTHLDWQYDGSLARQNQVAALFDLAARHHRGDGFPVVVGGDFNAVPDSVEIGMMTGRHPPPREGLAFIDSWAAVGRGDGITWTRGNPHAAQAQSPERRLDYVFVAWPRDKPVGNVVRAELFGVEPVGGLVPSDHYGVFVDLVTPED
ncbi:MAG: endonuclease [Actinomycetia bacterium]|nr:endonuclease [Actinomycetes bacterium]MCP4087717.1 endonuclease [Actinomycetes bacterium]